MAEPKIFPRRPNADYRWTRAKIVAFLQALVLTGSVKSAARQVGMSRQSAYRLRERLGPDFAASWDQGLALRHRFGAPRPDIFLQDRVNPSTSVSPCEGALAVR